MVISHSKSSKVLTLKSFFLLAVILFSFSLISAAQINFTKGSSDFNQGETLIAKVSANFIEQPTSDNVFFYRDGHIRVSFVYETSKINDDFYIYALLNGKQAGNYSIVLGNVRYMNGALESDENITKDFTISGNLSDFSVTPGFVSTSEDFFLEVQNLQSEEITVSTSTSDNLLAPNSINIKSGEIKEINFVRSGQGSFETIKLSSPNTEYFIPVSAGVNVTPSSSQQTASSSDESFKFEPNRVSISMATDTTSKRIIYLLNTGDTKITNLTFFVPASLSPYVTVSSSKDIKLNSSEQVEIAIDSGSVEKNVVGTIIARTENSSSSFVISLDFVKDYVPPVEESSTTETLVLTTCTQLKGNICNENQTCSGETAKVREGVCCLATCETTQKSSTGKIIGWSMVAVVILFLFYFFKRYKRVRPQVDLLKIGKK